MLLVPNLVWEAQHGWVSVHWFVNPPPSATDESRPGYVLDLLETMNLFAVPVAVAGVVLLHRLRGLRPLAWTGAGTVLAYLALGGKSYYAMPAVSFALAAGAVPLDRWATRRRLVWLAVPFAAFLLVALPIVVPVLPLHAANAHGVVKDRSDYQDEVGWPELARNVEADAGGTDVVLAQNYGEAGALELFGHGLPPVASPDVTFRYWRPAVAGRRALPVGFSPRQATFCSGYRVVSRIRMPVDNQERGQPIARCTLTASLAALWPGLVARFGE